MNIARSVIANANSIRKRTLFNIKTISEGICLKTLDDLVSSEAHLHREIKALLKDNPTSARVYIRVGAYCTLAGGGGKVRGWGGVIFTELFSSRERISSNRVRVKVFDVICLTLFVGSLVMCNTILIGVVDREKRTQYFFSSASVQLGAL